MKHPWIYKYCYDSSYEQDELVHGHDVLIESVYVYIYE